MGRKNNNDVPQLNSRNGGPNQQYVFKRESDGFYTIKNYANNLYLEGCSDRIRMTSGAITDCHKWRLGNQTVPDPQPNPTQDRPTRVITETFSATRTATGYGCANSQDLRSSGPDTWVFMRGCEFNSSRRLFFLTCTVSLQMLESIWPPSTGEFSWRIYFPNWQLSAIYASSYRVTEILSFMTSPTRYTGPPVNLETVRSKFESEDLAGNLIWRHPAGPHKLVMQADGNLVQYGENNQVIWKSDTYLKGKAPFVVSLGDNARLSITDSTGEVTWTNGL